MNTHICFTVGCRLLQSVFASTEFASFAIGLAFFLIALVVEWNAILNHIRLKNMSLAMVEKRHPRLPNVFEIITASLLTIAFVILFFQFVHRVYAMTYTLYESTNESKDTSQVIMADIDNDGDIDQIAFNNDSNNTWLADVYKNSGNGSFTQFATVESSYGFRSAYAGDVDGDGDVDFVESVYGGSQLQELINDGSGNFSRTVIISSLAISATNVLLMDIENDGDLDLVAGGNSHHFAVYINDGDGNFTLGNSYLPDFHSMASGDFNGDGYQDLALSVNDSSHDFRVFINSGTGAFSLLSEVSDRPADSHVGIKAADLDGDGDVDILLGVNTNAPVAGRQVPYLNNGSGYFSTPNSGMYGDPLASYGAATGDLDNDGDNDFIVAGTDGAATNAGNEIWLNSGDATSFLQSGTPTEESDCTYDVALGDIDNDGDLDYSAGNSSCIVGSGKINRVYKSDQSATTPNTAPTAPSVSTLSGNVIKTPVYPQDANDNSGVGTVPWNNTTNGRFSDDSYAVTSSMAPGENSHYLVFDHFGFAVPTSATILGIKVEVEKVAAGACVITDNRVRIVKGGSIQSTDLSNGAGWSNSDAFVSYGSGGNLWGTTWTPANINATNFGFAISAHCAGAAGGAKIDSVRMYVYYTMTDVTFTWGAGSDSESSTNLLQYKLKVGTTPGGNDIVSGVTASPQWLTRLMPNSKKLSYTVKNVPCNGNVYWSVATVDTGFKSTWSSEASFSLSSICAEGSLGGGGGTTGGTGGGGGAAWLQLLQNSTLRKAADGGSSLAYGFLTIEAFHDVNGNGAKDERETASFKGLPVTISGNTVEGKQLSHVVYVGAEGMIRVRIRESDGHGYEVRFGTGSDIVHDFVSTTKEVAHVVVKDGSDEKIEGGFQRRELFRLQPCMQIGDGDERNIGVAPALTLLTRLRDIYGLSVVRDVSLDAPLMTRRDFLTLVLRTNCIDPVPQAKIQEKLREAFSKGTVPWWTAIELKDVRLSPYNDDASLVYSLLAHGIPAVRESQKGGIADLGSPISRREAMLILEAAMNIPVARRDDKGDELPVDLPSDDPLVPHVHVLQNLGVLPESFFPVLGADQGLDTAEAPTLLMRAAFRAGRIDMLPAIKTDEEQQSSFLSVLPAYAIPACVEMNPDRPGNISFTDVLPGTAFYTVVRPLLSYGTKAADGQMLWLLTATPKFSEYGVEKAETTFNPDAPASIIETVRGLLVLSCLPPDSRASVTTSGAKGSLVGSGESRIARDRISDLPRDATLNSRILYRAQDRIRAFDLSLFSFAPSLLKGEFRAPTSAMSVREASELASSALLGILVKNHVLTFAEAEGKMQELSHALMEDMLAAHISSRDMSAADKTVFSRRHLVRFLSEALKGVQEDRVSPVNEGGFLQLDAGVHTLKPAASDSTPERRKEMSLGEIWWERVR